jgi:hypothetical protein
MHPANQRIGWSSSSRCCGAQALWLSAALALLPTRVALAQPVPVSPSGSSTTLPISGHRTGEYQFGSHFLPRFTLLEVQYPQGLGIGAGGWAILSPGSRTSLGLVGELELGLSGVDAALGAGVVGNRGGDVEDHFSIGLEGVAMKSWPGWSLALPADQYLVGVRAFVFGSILRCSVGVLWPVHRAGPIHFVPTIGCGVGFL